MEEKNKPLNVIDIDREEIINKKEVIEKEDIIDGDQNNNNKNLQRRKSTLMGLRPKIWIFISSSFSIFFNFFFSLAGIVSVTNFSLLSFFKIVYVWIWLGGFFASLLFGICLIFLTAYDKLSKESRNLLRFYEILILINVGSVLIAIVYDLYYFCIKLLINFLLDGVLIGLSVLSIIFYYIQWLSLKRHFDPLPIVVNKIKRTQTEMSIQNKINDFSKSDSEVEEPEPDC